MLLTKEEEEYYNFWNSQRKPTMHTNEEAPGPYIATGKREDEIKQKIHSAYKPIYKDDFRTKLGKVIDGIYGMLLEKNRKYGNSVSEPINTFSKLSPIAAINVRIDDKLARIKSGQPDETEDSELDLIGYLILKRVLRYEQVPDNPVFQPSENSTPAGSNSAFNSSNGVSDTTK